MWVSYSSLQTGKNKEIMSLWNEDAANIDHYDLEQPGEEKRKFRSFEIFSNMRSTFFFWERRLDPRLFPSLCGISYQSSSYNFMREGRGGKYSDSADL